MTAARDATRCLLVGAGRMGRVHLQAAHRHPDVAIVALADPLPASVDDQTNDVRQFVDLADALDWGGFDAAVVAAPSDLHLDVVSTLARAGIPMLCEKPLGLTAADAMAAGQAAEAGGVPLQVGYWRRFVPELVDLQARIARGDFGAITLIQAWQWDETPPSPEFRRRSGGIVRDMGVHEIDQIRWLTGESLVVRSVVASEIVTTDDVVPGDPESVAILAQLAGGGVGIVSLGRRHAAGDECWLDVIGSAAGGRVDFMRGTLGEAVFLAAIRQQLTAFAEVVHGAEQRGANAADAVASLSALEDADQLLATEVSNE